MIFVTAKFRVLPEHADRWTEVVHEFTQATRSEPGCLWFDWSRSVEDPTSTSWSKPFATTSPGPHTSSPSTSGARS